jgi:hypothetical protein
MSSTRSIGSETAAIAIAGGIGEVARIRSTALISSTDDLVVRLFALLLLTRFFDGQVTDDSFERRVERASGLLGHMTCLLKSRAGTTSIYMGKFCSVTVWAARARSPRY